MSRVRWDLEMLSKVFSDNGCLLLDTEYRGVNKKYRFVCSCGIESSKRFANFRERPFCSRCGNTQHLRGYREYLRELNKDNKEYCVIRPRGTYGEKDILVDREDFEFLISEGLWGVNKQGYSERHNPETKSKDKMHRVVLNAQDGDIVDHINHDKLDNRKSNLRFVSHTQNGANIKKKTKSAAGYKGVTYSDSDRYKVRLGYKNKRVYAGTFTDLKDAVNAYNEAAYILHGEYAHLNKYKEDE